MSSSSNWTAVNCSTVECASSMSNILSSSLKSFKDHLPINWDVCCLVDGRLFYLDHLNERTQWVPPIESWHCPYGLPYAWEIAIDTTGKAYYINHLDEETTYEDPRMELYIQPPEPRDVVLQRDTQLGFGFVAGSEKPVVVRFVTEGGPSHERLLPGDEIWFVNGEDVREAAKDHVVQLVRNCSEEVRLTVCQKRTLDSNIKSALLSAAKRVRLKNNPPRVRFAEGVLIGTPPDTPRGTESCVALMPNVLRVFLENGQTKSFKYDQTTTVQDVMENLQEKLGLRCIEHFSLTLEHPQGPRSNKLSLLRPEETIAKIAARPGSQHFRCLFRVIFVPNDPVDLLKNDPVAFEYLYQQCVNDVVQGRYAFEMRYEACLRLAALQMQQCSLDNHCSNNGRVSLKAIEKEYGLNTFLPSILLENVKLKEIRKHLRYYLKRDVSQPASTQGTPNHHSPLRKPTIDLILFQNVNLDYSLEHSSNSLHGSLPISLAIKETNTDMLMQVGPKTGITVRNTGRNIEPTLSLFYDLIAHVTICAETEVLKLLSIKLKNDQSQTLDFLVDKDDVDDLVLLMQGYYFLLTRDRLNVQWEEEFSEPPVPPYLGLHSVRVSNWNYINNQSFGVDEHKEHLVDLSRGPPKYQDMVNEVPVRRYSKDNVDESESTALVNSINQMESSVTTVVDVQLHSQTNENRNTANRRRNSEDDEEELQDTCASLATNSTKLSSGRKQPPQSSSSTEIGADGFVRRTFLRARDSLIIRNRSNSRSKDLVRLRSRSREREGDLSSVSESDTESLSTPSESPIHRPAKRNRPIQLPVNGKNPSFGLQSPDTLPCSLLSDAELQQIITNCGLEGQQLEDLLLLFPDNFCTDSEIIDLTMLPPPKTPDGPVNTFVVTEAIKPPTPFADLDPRQQFDGQTSTSTNDTHNTTKLSPSKGSVTTSAAKHLMRRHVESSTTTTKKEQQKLPAEFYNWLMQPSGSEIGLDNKTTLIDASQFPSIENREEFEQFLQRHIVPPPPPVATNSDDDVVFLPPPSKHQQPGRSYSNRDQPVRRVSFSAQTTVTESNEPSVEKQSGCLTGPLQRRRQSTACEPARNTEHLINIARQNWAYKNANCTAFADDDVGANVVPSRVTFDGRTPNTYRTSSTIVEKQVTTVTQPKATDKLLKSLKAGFKRKNSLDVKDSADLLSEYDPSRPPQYAYGVRRVSLKEYVGLEESEHTPPEITSVALRNFVGLETTSENSPDAVRNGGAGGLFNFKSLKSEMEAINETPNEADRRPSVEAPMVVERPTESEDNASKDSPKKSPLCPRHAAQLKILSEEVERVNSALEAGNIEPSELFVSRVLVDYSAAESKYPNYIYHRRRSSVMGGQTDETGQQDSMWPTSETSEPGNTNPNTTNVGSALPLVNGSLPNDNNHPDASEEDFERAKDRINVLVDQLKEQLEHFPAKSPRRAVALSTQKSRFKNDLLNESQQFAAAGKLLVRSVTEPRGKLLPCLEHSCDKAKGIHEAALQLINAAEGLFQAQTLAAKVREVLVAFERTLDAAKNARGKPLGDAEMKRLMRQSTTLAATLTQLIRTVRET